MPNYKVFQDEPDRLRTKIYGGNDVPLNTDASGNLGVSTIGTVAICTTSTVPISSIGTLPVCTTGTVSVSTIGTTPVSSIGTLPISTVNDIPICSTKAVPVCASSTLPVSSIGMTPVSSVGTLPVSSIGTLPVCTTATIPVSTIGTIPVTGLINMGFTTTDIAETTPSTNLTTYTGATKRVVLGQEAWTFTVKNLSTTGKASVQVQMSATAIDESDWLQEVAPVTINQGGLAFLTSSLLVKYARVYYKANDANPIQLSIIFQAQS